MNDQSQIAVLVPCYNEAATIARVIADFRRELPEAGIYVFDNCCTDATADIARREGATVLAEPRKGKGFVVEAMLDRVDADYYIMVDGDDTYPADQARKLLDPVMSGRADMVVGARLETHGDKSFRPLHVAGNGLVRKLVNVIFGAALTDVMSGYRAFNRKVASRIPVVSPGFEVETELTVNMLYYKLSMVEVQIPYGQRPEGSHSKLRTFRDGFRVLWKIFNLFRAYKPLTFFGGIGLVMLAMGLGAGLVPVRDYIATGRVPHVGLAVLATGLVLLSAMAIVLGLLLHAINWRFKELHNVMVRKSR